MRSIIKKEFTLSNEEQEILARACRIKLFTMKLMIVHTITIY